MKLAISRQNSHVLGPFGEILKLECPFIPLVNQPFITFSLKNRF